METAAPLHPAEELALDAPRRELVGAEEAGSAAGGEGAHDEVAGADAGDVAAGLHDFTHEFVAHHRARVESGLAAVPDVEVRPADSGEPDADERVGGLAEHGIGHQLDPEVVGGVVGDCLHWPWWIRTTILLSVAEVLANCQARQESRSVKDTDSLEEVQEGPGRVTVTPGAAHRTQEKLRGPRPVTLASPARFVAS